jgi:CubicO group peptidase (beta-lactamase class C family)
MRASIARMRLIVMAAVLAASALGAVLAQPSAREALIARAKAVELPTPYVPPPGDAVEHHAAGFAKVICSAVFITGLDPDFAVENVGYFTAPYEQRSRMGKPVIDRNQKAVHVRLPSGVTRTARHLGDQGCVTLASGKTDVDFRPVRVHKKAPPPDAPWPAGDALPAEDAVLKQLDAAKVRQAVDAAFEPAEAMTAAFVVAWKGRLVAERYGAGITASTPLESWSMGKSLTATLMGVLIEQGAYTLWQPAPVPEWQKPGDPRAKIRIGDLLQMSSGLRIRAPQDPDFDPSGPYPDHLYFYTGPNAFQWAATRPLQWPPAAIGRYHNSDPALVNYLIRLAVEKRGEEYLSFPQRALLDRIGIRTMVMETDPAGNFLTQGYELASARDWARLGTLYLQDGVWNGQRLLPAGWTRFVSTVAPAWEADKRPIYGAFFWINGEGTFPVPRDAYYMSGAGGQTTLIVPSHDLVVVRLGHFKGSRRANEGFLRALALLMDAVPARQTRSNGDSEQDGRTTQMTQATVERFNDAINRQDIAAVAELLHERTVFENTNPPPDGTRIEGKDAVRAFWEKWFAANRGARFDAEEVIVAGDRCTVRWVYRKMRDGQPWHLRGVDVFTVRDGKVLAKLSYVKG